MNQKIKEIKGAFEKQIEELRLQQKLLDLVLEINDVVKKLKELDNKEDKNGKVNN